MQTIEIDDDSERARLERWIADNADEVRGALTAIANNPGRFNFGTLVTAQYGMRQIVGAAMRPARKERTFSTTRPIRGA
jgi:hypothetical protein